MAVAIRTITRLQDADDAPSLGAGQNGYALTWDNASGAFVATALFTGGLLATGATTGATSQAQEFTVGVKLADTTTSTTGVVFKGTTRFLHNFHHPTGDAAIPLGYNVWLGELAGNFTTGSTASDQLHGSYNVAVGYNALQGITTGYRNMALGALTMTFLSSGRDNAAIGAYALFSLGDGAENLGIGTYAGMNITSGSRNICLGYEAARYHADGSTGLETPENSIYLGSLARGLNNDDANTIVIGYQAISHGANTTVIGNTSTTAATIYGAGAFPLLSAVTNAVSNVLTLTHDTSGTAAAGFGAGVALQLESSTTAAQSAAAIKALWYEATHASRKADLVLTAYDTAEREGLRIRGAGSAAAIGFLGATPAAQQSHVADASTTHAITDPSDSPADADALRDDLVNNVIPSIETALNNLGTKINSLFTTLETFGLHATS